MKKNTESGRVRAGVLGALLALAALGGAGAWWWKARAPGSAPAAGEAGSPGVGAGAANRRFGGGNRVQPVSVAQAQQRDLRVLIHAIGNMAALNTAVVRAKVDGELKAIRFKEGQTVRAGDVLAQIDSRSQEVQLAQALGQLARDQALLRNAQIDLARYQDLLSKDAIARQQVDTQEALVQQLKGTVQTDQAQVDGARLQLSHTQVLAPISGRLGLKQADLGSTVRASDALGLISITQTQPIALVFAVPEAHLPQILDKLKGQEPLTVEVWDREQRRRLGVGRVLSTDNTIDAATGTLKLKAEFANADGRLFPNQFVNVRLQLATQSQAVVVPGNAIQRGAQGTFVYVVQSDGTVTLRHVRTGTVEGDWVAVDGEVTPGEQVVTDGADRLREGAKVEVITPRSGPGGNGKPAGASPPASAAPPAAASASTPTSASASASASKPAPTKTPAPRPPASTAPPASASAPAPDGGDAPPPWLARLPPDVQERFKAMNPDERREFIQKLRERRRQQREAEGG